MLISLILYIDVHTHRYKGVLHPVGSGTVSVLKNELAIGPRRVLKFHMLTAKVKSMLHLLIN